MPKDASVKLSEISLNILFWSVNPYSQLPYFQFRPIQSSICFYFDYNDANPVKLEKNVLECN